MTGNVQRNTDPQPREQDSPEAASLVDTMAEQSFPASDPPAVWTWDPPAPTQTPPAA